MEFLKCWDVRWKGPKKRNKPDVLATTANHPDERGWMQPTYMRSVSFWGKFTSGSRISASRSDLLKVPNILGAATVLANAWRQRGLIQPHFVNCSKQAPKYLALN